MLVIKLKRGEACKIGGAVVWIHDEVPINRVTIVVDAPKTVPVIKKCDKQGNEEKAA
jgi:sRNA-binding carbon storage regulator CsrA